jgi:hypothetical protein
MSFILDLTAKDIFNIKSVSLLTVLGTKPLFLWSLNVINFSQRR